MKKLVISTVAIAALTLSGNAAVAGQPGGGEKGNKAKFDTTITLEYNQGNDPYDPYYEEAVFRGKIKVSPANKEARQNRHLKRKCKKRNVVIKNKSIPNPQTYAKTRSDKQGNYSVSASEAYTEPGEYQAKAVKKRKVKAGVKCFGAKSNRVTVPTP